MTTPNPSTPNRPITAQVPSAPRKRNRESAGFQTPERNENRPFQTPERQINRQIPQTPNAPARRAPVLNLSSNQGARLPRSMYVRWAALNAMHTRTMNLPR